MTKRIKSPGPLPKPTKLKGDGPSVSESVIADRDITSESMANYHAGNTLALDKLWARIDAGPGWGRIPTSKERGEAKVTLALLALLGLSEDDVDAGRVSEFSKAIARIGSDLRSAAPRDMDGIMSELERLRIEVEELRSDRDHWMRLWQRASTELLRRTPPSEIPLPGDVGQATVINLLDLDRSSDEEPR